MQVSGTAQVESIRRAGSRSLRRVRVRPCRESARRPARDGRRPPRLRHADPLQPGPVLSQLDKFLDELLAETGPAVVIGHSMIGPLTLRLAERAPEELLAVIAAPPIGLDLTALHTVGARRPRWPLAPLRLLPHRARRKLSAAIWTSIAVADRDAATPEFLDAYTGFFSANCATPISSTACTTHCCWSGHPRPTRRPGMSPADPQRRPRQPARHHAKASATAGGRIICPLRRHHPGVHPFARRCSRRRNRLLIRRGRPPSEGWEDVVMWLFQ